MGRGPLDQLFATASPEVLIYGPPGTTLRELRWTARDGSTIGRPGEPLDAWDLRISPDGTRVAITELDPQSRTLDVWIRERSQPVPKRLSISTDADESGVWSPDGNRIAWVAAPARFRFAAPARCCPNKSSRASTRRSRCGTGRAMRLLLVGRTAADTRDDLWIVPLVEGIEERPYAAAAFNQVQVSSRRMDDRSRTPPTSPASSTSTSIRFRSPVRASASRPRAERSRGGRRWTRDLFSPRLRDPCRHVSPATVGSPRERLFDAGATIRSYDVTADGKRFLLNCRPAVRPRGQRHSS